MLFSPELTLKNEEAPFLINFCKQAVLILGASLLIGLTGVMAIPLPFSPVPLAIQSHVILLMASLLGPKRAFLAVIAFLIEGSLGLPVFAQGKAGLVILLGPTGGYLIGYALAAFVTGYLVEKIRKKSVLKILAAMLAGSSVILICGFLYLAQIIGYQAAFMVGVLPFVLGDILKSLVATRGYLRIKQ